MKAILIHRAFEARPITVATMEANDSVFEKDVLEKFYTSTQNVHDSWSNPDIREYDGSSAITWIEPLQKNKKGETLGHRSTSVGDIIIIKWKSDIRMYQCSVVGWKIIDIMEFLKIMGYSRTDCRDYVSDLYREKETA